MAFQLKTEPGSLSSGELDDDGKLVNMSIPDLIFELRIATCTKQFDQVEQVLVAREAQLKDDANKMREILELGRLEKMEIEAKLKECQKQCEETKRGEYLYGKLLANVKKNGLQDTTVEELRAKNSKLEVELNIWKEKFLELNKWISKVEYQTQLLVKERNNEGDHGADLRVTLKVKEERETDGIYVHGFHPGNNNADSNAPQRNGLGNEQSSSNPSKDDRVLTYQRRKKNGAIMAGLLDQYTVAGDSHALKMVTWIAEYFYSRVQNVISKYSITRHYQSLNEETGGMNDVLYKLYSITGGPKHLLLAHLFDKPCFLGLLAVEANDIANFHANTHIPVVIGSQMRYEVIGGPLYKEIGTFLMDIINSSHSYATGGTSVSEFWHDPKRMAENLKTTENEESCTTYNILKVSRNLFRWTKEVSYADYYERALTNGVLGIQRGTDPGVMIYMLPQGSGVSKAKSWHGWGTKFESFWCCYGTGIESFSKLGDSIYFEEGGKNPTLYIIQYISSSLNWKCGGVMLNQTVVPTTSWDPYLRVTLTFSLVEGTGPSSTLNFRIPTWTHLDGAKAVLNDEILSLPSSGNFLSVTRKWSSCDRLTLQLPVTLRTEAIKDDRSEYASIKAILYGPYLLVGHTTGSDWDIKVGSNASMTDWITPIPSSYNTQVATFFQDFDEQTLVLTNSNQSITMEKLPKPGTESAPHATFRLIFIESSSEHSTLRDVIGKSVMLEPFDLPGMLLMDQGAEHPLVIADSSPHGGSSSNVFLVVAGLDGQNETISFESRSNKGCFVYNGGSGSGVMLKCKSDFNIIFNQAASFRAGEGLSQYNAISFVAKGANRNFLLEPLFSFRDEPYTVYFNIQA